MVQVVLVSIVVVGLLVWWWLLRRGFRARSCHDATMVVVDVALRAELQHQIGAVVCHVVVVDLYRGDDLVVVVDIDVVVVIIVIIHADVDVLQAVDTLTVTLIVDIVLFLMHDRLLGTVILHAQLIHSPLDLENSAGRSIVHGSRDDGGGLAGRERVQLRDSRDLCYPSGGGDLPILVLEPLQEPPLQVSHPCDNQQDLLAEVDADNVVHHRAVVRLNWDDLCNNPNIIDK